MEESNRHSKNYPPLKRLSLDVSLLMSPPENSSEKTSIELELLENIGRRIEEEDEANIRKYNGNVLKEYYHIMDQFSLTIDKFEIEELLEDIQTIVCFEKEKHKRPRPLSVGKTQGFVINEEFQLNSSSSYPSGHATESMFLSLYLADAFPLYKDVFMETANKISNSRLLSSNNYPTDNLAGHTLAHVLYTKYKEQKNGK